MGNSERAGLFARRLPDAGFSLLELIFGLSLFMISFLAVGLALHSGIRSTQDILERQLVQARARTLIDRMTFQNFGSAIDLNPSSQQIAEIFDDDDDPGDISLHQLSRYPVADGGWVFTLADFPVEGEWRVSVDTDLDDNGAIAGPLEESGKIFRIRVFFEEELYLATDRAEEVSL